MTKRFLCIICPNSCLIEVDYTQRGVRRIKGSLCKKGDEYVQKELFFPTRVLTSSIRVVGGELPLVSVKTNQPIPKAKIMKAMKILRQTTASAPIKIGDILIKSVAQTGADIVATKSIR